MSNISINGRSISIGGTLLSVVINNGRVTVNGQDVTPEDAKDIHISIEGHVDSIRADACNSIEVTGNVQQVQTQSGSVQVGGDVLGSVSTMSGSIECDGKINGSVSTMSGDVRSR